MVIACSKCQTRFHVEDARIPAEGVRVRCSKCKHAFFVRPPRAPADAAVHAVAEAAAVSGTVSTPEPSFELDRAAAPVGPAEEEDDWQFAIDPPSAAAARAPLESNEASAEPPPPASPGLDPEAGPRRAAEGPETSSLADLESPESWDLLGGGRRALPEESEEIAETELEETGEAGFDDPRFEAVTLPGRRRRVRPVGAGLGVQVLGWIALASLVALLGRGLLAYGAGVAATHPEPLVIAGLEAREIRGRVVENALAGPLFVVTGTLANRGPGARAPERAIRVVLLDVADEPLPGAALAGPPLPPAQIRLHEPRALRSALEAGAATLARRRLAVGEVVPFQAVFEGSDPAAVAFRLEEAPAPALPPVERPADALPGEAAGESAAASASSPSGSEAPRG